MLASIFIETTIPSYHVARPSRDLVLFTRQQLTREWWRTERHRFDLYTSELVLDEASDGDASKSAERLRLLSGVPILKLNEQIADLAIQLVERGIVPETASRDATHLAVAGIHKMDYLLTWNCKHIANPHLLRATRCLLCRRRGPSSNNLYARAALQR